MEQKLGDLTVTWLVRFLRQQLETITLQLPALEVDTLIVKGRETITSLAKKGSPKLSGDVTLSEGTGVTLTQAGKDIKISSSGGGGGSLPDPSAQPNGAWLRVSGGAAVWSATPQVTESDITLADVTTLNASTTKHGLVPKLPNDAAKFLDGTGAFSTPPGGGSALVGFGQRTSNAASTGTTYAGGSDLLASAITFPADGTSTYLVTVSGGSYAMSSTGGTGIMSLNLDSAQSSDVAYVKVASTAEGQSFFTRAILPSLSAGNHTLNLKLYASAGTFTVSGGAGGSGAVDPILVTVEKLVAGGGSSPVSSTRISRSVGVGGDIALATNASFVELAAASGGPGTGGLDLAIPATPGDVLQVSGAFTFNNVTAIAAIFDIATWVSGAAVNWLGQSAGSGSNIGLGFQPSGVAGTFHIDTEYVVQAGDITGGNIVLRTHYRAGGGRTLARSVANGPLSLSVANLLH